MVRIGEAIIDFKTQLVNFKKGVGEAQTTLGKFGAFVRTNSQGFRNAGIALTAFTAAMATLGIKGVISAAKFQKELQNVATMLDDTTMKFMPTYKKALEDLSRKYGESTATLSKGLYDILSASVDAGSALEVLEVSAQMGRAGLTDTGVAADALTTILNAYQLQASKAGDVSDLLFAIVKRGKTTMAELAPSIGVVATTASVAGLSLESMGAMLATMTRSGINTRVAVTSLNAVMTGLLKPTGDAKAAFKEITTQLGLKNVELNTTTLRERGLIGIVKLLNNATDEQVAKIFPNIRAFRGLAVALNDTTGFEKDLEIMTNRTGLTMEAFAKQTDTIAFSFDIFGQKVEALFRKLGEFLLPTVQKVINVIMWLLDGILNMNSAMLGFIITVAGLATALAGLAAPILLLLGFLPQIILGLKALYPAVTKLWAIIAAHPIVAVTAALAVLINLIADYTIAQIEARNATINMAKSTQDLINKHRAEIKAINEVLAADRDASLLRGNSVKELIAIQGEMVNSHKLSAEEREALEKKLAQIVTALKAQEKKLFMETEGAKTEKVESESEKRVRLAKELSAKRKKIGAATLDFLIKTGQISLAQQKSILEQRLNAEKLNVDQTFALKTQLFELEKQLEEEKTNLWNETYLSRMETFANTVGQMTNLASSFADLQKINIQNEMNDNIDAAEAKYKERKKWIDENVSDEEEKTKLLDDLEKSHQATVSNVRDAAAREEKRRGKELKPFLIAEAIANTALGVTKAFAQGGLAGIITGAIVGAAGAVQIAKINAQRFAQGGIVGGNSKSGDNVIAKVNSGEMILNSAQQSKLFDLANGTRTNGVGVINLGDTKIIIQGDVTGDNTNDILRRISTEVKKRTIESIRMVKAVTKEGSFRQGEAY